MDTTNSAATHKGHIPGEVGVWVFILGDMLIFGLFFSVFMYYRSLDLDTYISSQQQLNQHYGAFNTLLLLTSSWFVALGLRALRKGVYSLAPKLFTAGLVCGIGFVVVKIFEYSDKIGHGITLTSNEFFMFYFMYTGIHCLHVLIGLIVLTLMIRRAKNSQFNTADQQLFESGSAYWHMVDLLWIVLFPLLYLVK